MFGDPLKRIVQHKAFKLFLSILISGGFLYYSFRNVDGLELQNSLKQTSFLILLIPFALTIFQNLLRAVRWKKILQDDSLSTTMLFNALSAGNLASYILPLRGGEIVRPAYSAKQGGVQFTRGLMSVVVERVFDLSTVLFLFFISSFLVTMPALFAVAAKSAGLGIAICTILFFLDIDKPILSFFCSYQHTPALLKKMGIHVSHLLEEVREIKKPKLFVTLTLYSAVIWIVAILGVATSLLAFPELMSHLSFLTLSTDSLIILVSVALAVALPSAPGFIGVYQLGCMMAAELVHLPTNAMLAFALITHLCAAVATALMGLVAFLGKKA